MKTKNHSIQSPEEENFFKRIPEALLPRKEIRPSEDLRDRILEAADKASQKTRRLHYWSGTILSVAASLLLAILLIGHTPAYAARKYFEAAVKSFQYLTSLQIQFSLRTAPQENFDYIDPAGELLPHHFAIRYTPPMMWRIEKPGRIALFNGEACYQWLPELEMGWRSSNRESEGLIQALCDLQTLMHSEIAATKQNKEAQYEITQQPDYTELIIQMPAQGDFTQSNWQRNTSISESDTRRTYHFDNTTGALRYACIEGFVEGRKVVLLETQQIRYNEEIIPSALDDHPTHIEWISSLELKGGTEQQDLTAEESAERIILAMEQWEEEILHKELQQYGEKGYQLLKEHYQGVKLLQCGAAFRSGLYPGYFVPCHLLFPDGRHEKINLALRNDNPDRVWIVDGGL